MQIDPADPTKQVPDDKLTVIDLTPLKPTTLARIKSAVGVKGAPAAPKVLATLQAGKGAAGVSINKAGTLALVANRSEGTVSVFTISGNKVEAAGKVTVGNPDSGPSHVAFSPDGKTALVTRDNDHTIVVLSVDGNKVEPTKREIRAGLRPYAIDISSKGEVAVVGNVGTGGGDADTISVIDLKLDPPRVVNTYTVGQTPEGIKISPDGKFVAVTVMNGSNKPPGSPFYNANGLLQVWSRNGTQLTKSGELQVGKWCQGVAWSSNSKTLLVQCMVEEEITVVRFSGLGGKSLQKAGTIKVKGGPAGIRTAEP
jgi:DNA-binding beta-propeller fold protein YncE